MLGSVTGMKQQSITSLPLAPDEERRNRMVKYTVAMTVRIVCIVAMMFAQGWWLAVFAAGAIFLPYFAVVVANVPARRKNAPTVFRRNELPSRREGPL